MNNLSNPLYRAVLRISTRYVRSGRIIMVLSMVFILDGMRWLDFVLEQTVPVTICPTLYCTIPSRKLARN